MRFTITKTWDSSPVTHQGITMSLKPDDEGILMEVNAPFFNDPPSPAGPRGKPYNQLWNYEGTVNTCFTKFYIEKHK